jgi:hypothetical protein
VLDALGERLTTAEMAVRLCILVRRVEGHVSALLRKLAEPDRCTGGPGPRAMCIEPAWLTWARTW